MNVVAEAEDTHGRAGEDCRGDFPNDHQLAAARFSLAQLLMATDRKDEALPLLIMALHGGDHPKDGTDGLGPVHEQDSRASSIVARIWRQPAEMNCQLEA